LPVQLVSTTCSLIPFSANGLADRFDPDKEAEFKRGRIVRRRGAEPTTEAGKLV